MRDARPRRRDRGQALVEVALVAPLFFLMFFGIIDLARVIWANDVVANAAREGARFASVNAGDPSRTSPTEATPDEIRATRAQFLSPAVSNATVTVCFSKVHIAQRDRGLHRRRLRDRGRIRRAATS